MNIKAIKLPDGTTHNLVPGAGDIVVKSKLYFEAVSEDNVTYKKLVAEYVAPDPEDIDATGTLTVYDLSGNAMFTMDMNSNRFDLLSVLHTLSAGTLSANNLTANRILVSDADKNIVSSNLSASDLITTSNIGSQSVANATKWNNVVYDMSTANTRDTWIPVLSNGKFQHRVLAAKAGSATQPIYMVNGNVVACTYTLSKSVPSNAVFTDTNTWRPVQNNLTSKSTTDCLSAYQGRVLNESKVGSGDISGSFYKVSTLYTFEKSNNCLVQGSKGNYIWAITSWSDIRLKKNIKDSRVNALELINKIQMREFDFKDEKFGTHKDIGYVAQELMEVIPECVEEVELPDEDKEKYGVKSMYQVEDKHMIPYLVKAIQEQQRQIEKLKDVIES